MKASGFMVRVRPNTLYLRKQKVFKILKQRSTKLP